MLDPAGELKLHENVFCKFIGLTTIKLFGSIE